MPVVFLLLFVYVADFPVERGAELLHGSSSPSRTLAEAAGLTVLPAMSIWGGRVVDGGRVHRLLPAMGRYVSTMRAVRSGGTDPDTSLGDLLRDRRAGGRLGRLAAVLANDACTDWTA